MIEDAKGKAGEVIETASGLLKPKEETSPPKEIQALRDTFEETLEELGVTLVVLIDDLDRCLPETTISTLEAIRLFLFLKNTAFVIAADNDMIKHAVRRHFEGVPDDLLVTNYFDKLIQVPIRVPPLGTQEVRAYMMLLFVESSGLPTDVKEKIRAAVCAQLRQTWQGKRVDRAFVQSLHDAFPPELIGRFDTADRLAPMMTTASGIVGNPRLIKRFLNALAIRMAISNAQGVGVDEAVAFRVPAGGDDRTWRLSPADTDQTMHHTTSTTFHPDLIVNGLIVETEEEFRVSARLKDDVIAELRPAHFHRHDLRTVVVADIPAYSDRQGRYLPVVIEVQIPRFKDPRTGDTVLGRPPSLPAGYKATSRLLAAIDDAWIEPSAGLASRLCLPESTVRQIRMRRLKNKDAAFRPVASDIIGIDEVHVGRMALRLQSHSRKRGLGVITAPEGNRILAITRDTKQESIEQALRGLAQLDRVRFVTIDMTPHYRAAIRAVLPAATIIVDRWHVRKLIVEIVQNVRKRMVKASADRKKLPRPHWLIAKRRGQLSEAEKLLLDEWLAQNPLLREAYWLKESFCEIYANCDDSFDAKAKYDLWLKSFPKAEGAPDSKACRVANEIQVLFQDFKATVEKWKEEIFAWFDAPFDIRTRKRPSQGQAENRNGFIKKVYARSQGMDFETLRLRMVFGSNPLEYLVPKESTVREAALSSDRPRDSDLLDPLAA